MCYLDYLEENKILERERGFLNKSQLLPGHQWRDGYTGTSRAPCTWKVTDSLLLLQSCSFQNCIFPPFKTVSWHSISHLSSPPQSCSKLQKARDCSLIFWATLPCHAVNLWFRLDNVEVKSDNAKSLSKDITKTMEIKHKYAFKHQLQNWVSGFSIKLMPESTRSLWNFHGFSMQFFGTNSIIDYSVSCSTPNPSDPSFQSTSRHTQKKPK